MRLMSEKQILDEPTRKLILEEIKAPENSRRKKEYLKRYEIYKDNTKKYVLDALAAEGLKPSTIAQMSNRAANLSICKKIVNKKARAYSGGVRRDGLTDEQTLQISELARLLAFDTRMKKGDRFRELYKNCAYQIVPEIDLEESSETELRYKMKLAVLPPWQYDVIEDPYDREKPMVYILSDFKERAVGQAASEDSAGRHGRLKAVPTGTDGVDNAIADSPTDASNGGQFVWWSRGYHFTTDAEGRILPNTYSGDNPIGRLPIVNNAEEQDGQFWAQGGDDLVQGSILINKLLTDMNFIAYLQGFGQIVVTGKNIPESAFTFGPNNAVVIEHTAEDPTPSVQFLSADPPLDGWMRIVEQYCALLLTTNNLSASAVASNLSVQNMASGIAMIIEQAESTDSLTDKQKEYVHIERDLWDVVARWYGVYEPTGQLSEAFSAIGAIPPDMDVSIKFLEAKQALTEGERLGNIKLRKELGINEQVDLILMDNPDMTREDAEAKLAAIAAEKVERVASAMSSAISQTAKPEETEGDEYGMDDSKVDDLNASTEDQD